MKGLGILVLVLGIFVVLGAVIMDVSVPSGVGRVNNIGLMSDRQNYTIIGAVLSIAGLLMLILGRRRSVSVLDVSDSRTCPMCAETIKSAAIKCRFCGADVIASDQGVDEQGDNAVISGAWSKKGGENSYVEYLIAPVVIVGIIIVVVLKRI
ncbi:hypothetical protein CJU80_14975 [Pseudomonas fragi]|uniref:Phage immunity protein membrane protein n=1 Tax=Pseudomonas fragi TaxID=296 RepID=A0A449IRS4_PSEFR|nr:zinc ribbon domain-containing protein [Pseudomonas fragi]PAA39326.1 hypothetical protein CJU80_14975 [Pseudomonas fragi]VFB22079.1 phage immunity protein; membrane protein [Pseudomonas fragi]